MGALVGEAEVDRCHAQAARQFAGQAAQLEGGLAGGVARYRDICPAQAARNATAQRLGAGFFGSKTGRVVGRRAGACIAIGALVFGKEPREKPLAVALDAALDPPDFCQVYAHTDNHVSIYRGAPSKFRCEPMNRLWVYLTVEPQSARVTNHVMSGIDTSLESSLNEAEQAGLQAIEGAADIKALDALKSDILGKKSPIRSLMKRLGELPAEQRPAAGQAINGAAIRVEQAYAARHAALSSEAMALRIQNETIDVTLPGTSALPRGSVHPLNRTLQEMVQVLISMGYEVAVGPEVESEYNNFDALNIAANHPARDMHDTFYLPGGLILRTHTSPVQVRHMLSNPPPVAIISPGRVYRVDDVDATHSPVFHQLEGLYVDKDVSLTHLKGTLQEFLRAMFGADLKTRFRPSFFPFTEPSAEVDVQCFVCRGADKECRVCKGTAWIEVGGAGMVHPKVLENVGYDSSEVRGFAFGLGIERFTMLRYGLSSMRPLYENDVRFLRQFA